MLYRVTIYFNWILPGGNGYSPASDLNLMPAGKSDITKEHYETLAALRYALRQFLRFSEDAAHADRQANLTTTSSHVCHQGISRP